MSEKKLPLEIKPTIIPLPRHDPLCDVKVKCPICDELMLPYTIEPEDKQKVVRNTTCSFRMCPNCRSHFCFSREAQDIVWRLANK